MGNHRLAIFAAFGLILAFAMPAAAEPVGAKLQDELAGADIVGLQPGMSVAEADQTVRSHMDVGWLIESPAAAKPFSGYRAYYRADGQEAIAVYLQDATVYAVSRALTLPEGTRRENVFASLRDKYGKPQIHLEREREYVWASHLPGGGDGVANSGNWKASPCRSYPKHGIYFGDKGLKEGKYGEGWRLGLIPPPAVRTDTEDFTAWRECPPVLFVRLNAFDGKNSSPNLELVLMDLSLYDPAFASAEPKKTYVEPKL